SSTSTVSVQPQPPSARLYGWWAAESLGGSLRPILILQLDQELPESHRAAVDRPLGPAARHKDELAGMHRVARRRPVRPVGVDARALEHALAAEIVGPPSRPPFDDRAPQDGGPPD